MGTFWGSKESQPKRQHRFIFTFGDKTGNKTGELPSWVCNSVTRPSMEISTIEHPYLNYSFKYPGRAKWNNISVTLSDPMTPDASKVLYSWLTEAGYTPPEGDPGEKEFMRSFTKAKFAGMFGNISIKALDAEGTTKENWTLFNPIIVSVNWGEFNYTSEELLNITIDIAYDYAKIE